MSHQRLDFQFINKTLTMMYIYTMYTIDNKPITGEAKFGSNFIKL